MSDKYEKIVRNILELAEVEIGGNAPDAIVVHKREFFSRVVRAGSLGAGESYTAGWWDCEQLDVALSKILAANLPELLRQQHGSWRLALVFGLNRLAHNLFNLQSSRRAYQVGEKHYDLGNDLYQAMLDKEMNYSCAYFREHQDLDAAQAAKLDLICRKLQLQPGMRLLDIGCGWGAMARHAARNYGVSVLGVTISKEQLQLAEQMNAGLGAKIELRLQDYRKLSGQFDRIVSIGMFEHVGWKNYPDYFRAVSKCLRADGLFLLHSIGKNQANRISNTWIHKYIFPNYFLPATSDITRNSEAYFRLEDWHNFGAYYDTTLLKWWANFDRAYQSTLSGRYDQRFYRMWRYYLLSCAAAFRSGMLNVWQLVLRPAQQHPAKVYERCI